MQTMAHKRFGMRSPRSGMRGQSMVEFFVVCLALVPMFFMVVYIAK
jgi:TRAP-type mannitol/chloroaromatic compound transport system permease small subunit